MASFSSVVDTTASRSGLQPTEQVHTVRSDVRTNLSQLGLTGTR